MKKYILPILISAIFSSPSIAKEDIKPPSLSNLPSVSEHGLPLAPPETNEIRVLETFGHDLSKIPEQLNNYLLGVSFDKVTGGSLTSTLPVGVPFITYTGSQYWINQLSKGQDDLSSLINASLVLLLSTNEMLPGTDDVSIDGTINTLLIKLDEKGYWPASYLLAEHAVLAAHSRQVSMPEQQVTIDRLFRCAEVGFAPCQIRLGLQLIQNPKMKSKAIQLLQSGILIYDSDPRYEGQDVYMVGLSRDLLIKQSDSDPQ